MKSAINNIKDSRIEKMLEKLAKLSASDQSGMFSVSDKGDKIDLILHHMNGLIEKLESKNETIEVYKNKFENISEILLEYAVMDFSRKIVLSDRRDEIDAVSAGLNTLGEELESSFLSQKKYASDLEKINILLFESNEKVQAIFNNAPDAIIAKDLNYTITEWNKAAERMYGFKKEEVLGRYSGGIIHTEFILPYTESMANMQMQNSGGWSAEVIQWTERQDKMDILSNNSFLKSDEGIPTGYLCVNKNITELKKTQEALRISEEKFNKSFMLNPTGLALADLATMKFIEVNDSFLDIIGFQRDEVIGHTPDEIKIVDEEIKNQVIETLFVEGSIKNKEVSFRKKSGESGVMLFSAGLIEINNEQCALMIIHDISKRIAIEKELSKKSEELIRSNAELEQFAYVASHDLQEPLRMITSYVQLLEKHYKDKLDQDAHDFITYAIDGANRMQTLIYSLLEYSRINRVKPFEYMDLQDTLNEVLKDLTIAISESNAKIEYGALPVIFGDKVLIGQLFFNLIANALKFKSDRPVEINITGERQGNEFLFAVKDNGIGIQKEYSQKIFTIFQRLYSKDKYPGTGIGLAICKKIVERHEGKIWIESEVDKGTTFYFTIKSDQKRLK
ncbi:MAG: PAS domain S-box protein [Burkholderiales bacterium]|nr:PAS domain S-box protein [Bacteroidia bacterium]